MTKPIYELYAHDEWQIVFTKGDVSAEDFCAGAQRVYGGIKVAPPDVCRSYARWTPSWDMGKFEGLYLDYPVAPKRGAFKMTYAETFECPELEEYCY